MSFIIPVKLPSLPIPQIQSENAHATVVPVGTSCMEVSIITRKVYYYWVTLLVTFLSQLPDTILRLEGEVLPFPSSLISLYCSQDVWCMQLGLTFLVSNSNSLLFR